MANKFLSYILSWCLRKSSERRSRTGDQDELNSDEYV
jgi:hypothetical protein